MKNFSTLLSELEDFLQSSQDGRTYIEVNNAIDLFGDGFTKERSDDEWDPFENIEEHLKIANQLLGEVEDSDDGALW